MAWIYNSDLHKELKEGAKLQQARDVMPNQLAEKVVPVMEVNPKLLRRSNIVRTLAVINATSGTLYTTPSDKDFYVIAASLGVIKDATSTSVSSRMEVTIDGAAVNLLFIPCLTLTAQTATISNNYEAPIKIDRGTIISVRNSTNVANATTSGTIVGYLVDNINA